MPRGMVAHQLNSVPFRQRPLEALRPVPDSYSAERTGLEK